MSSFDGPIQIRDARRRAEAETEARLMMDRVGLDRTERLRAWRAWAAKHLLGAFNHWPADQAARDHAVGLCIGELEVIAKHLHDREWLFNAKRLAQIVEQAVAPIAAAQAAKKIDDFFPYFRSSIRRFVGMNAEQLQQAAKRDGVDGAAAIGDILAGVLGRVKTPSLVEDIAGRRAENRQQPCKAHARRGRPAKFQAAADATGDLFGG